jgi:hypothetical protein
MEQHIASIEQIKAMTDEQKTTFLANKFLSFSKRNALNVLLMCKIFHDTRNREFFSNFLTLIKVNEDESSSQLKKYMVIGKNYDKLVGFLDVLPSAWTTIYKIAEFTEKQLNDLKNSGHLHRTVTAQAIDAYTMKTVKTNSKLKSIDCSRLRISIPTTLTQDELVEVIQTLDEMKSRHLIDYQLPETILLTTTASNDENVDLKKSA